jgi:hypothetical protein
MSARLMTAPHNFTSSSIIFANSSGVVDRASTLRCEKNCCA